MQIKFVERLLSDATYDEVGGNFHRNDLAAGCAEWDATGRSLLFTCPCSCGQVHTVPVKNKAEMAKAEPRPGAESRNGWDWDGDRERPTLTPSIRIMERDMKTDHWHGHLTKGEWITV